MKHSIYIFATLMITFLNSTIVNSQAVVPVYGAIKEGFQTADHSGWIKLDGRLKSTLTATQQGRATTLGIGANLPDVTNKLLMDGTVLSATGSNNLTLVPANIPNISIAGTATSTDGNHTHTISSNGNSIAQNGNPNYGVGFQVGGAQEYGTPGLNYGGTPTVSTSGGAHNHVTSVPSGGTATAIDITPSHLGVNTFVYLGS